MSYKNLEENLVLREYFNQGGLWFWGRDESGQFGDNTTTNKSSPVQTVAGGTNWKLVSCGHHYTFVINESWGTIT